MVSKDYIEMEDKFGAHNYHPLPVVLQKVKEFMFGMLKGKNIMISFLLIQRLTKVTATQK